MPYAKEAFETLGETVVLDGRSITRDHVYDADILAIRSTTRVDRRLLEGSSVRFVGTATIGTDHIDKDYLGTRGIRWCYSPGCNADSVSEYVTAALLCLAHRHGFTLEGKTLGVVGVGNVGRLVVKQGRILGMRVLENDPPRQRSATRKQPSAFEIAAGLGEVRSSLMPGPGGTSGQAADFLSLDRVLEEADVITLHVPLTKEGQDTTFHMADKEFFAKTKPGCVFLNTARGAVVNTDALLTALHSGTVSHAVIDTWEGEPAYRKDLLEHIDIGTPHIAGHSLEGKVMGTMMVYREVFRFLGIEPSWTPESLLPPPIVPEIKIDIERQQDDLSCAVKPAGTRDEEVLWNIVHRVYDIAADDKRLRNRHETERGERGGGTQAAMGMEPSTMSHTEYFDFLRRSYPVRREFKFTRVTLKNASERLIKKVLGLGFQGGKAGTTEK